MYIYMYILSNDMDRAHDTDIISAPGVAVATTSTATSNNTAGVGPNR
jgi:hypothetical protein